MNNIYSLSNFGFLPYTICSQLPERYRESDTFVGLEQLFEILTVKSSEDNASEYRELVDNLEKEFETIPSCEGLSVEELRCMYAFTTFAAQKYVWCGGLVPDCPKNLPNFLATIWLDICHRLGQRPVLTYAGSVMYNWKYREGFQQGEELTLDNIECIFTFTGTEDERVFFTSMAVLEQYSNIIIDCYNKIYSLMMRHCSGKNKITVEKSSYNGIVCVVIANLKMMTRTMRKMHRILKSFGTQYKCDPTFFYTVLRKYLTGYNKEEFHPKGLLIGDDYYTYHGGSGAQSSFYYFMDMIFDIKHSGHAKEFMEGTLGFMPPEHLQFIEDHRNNLTLENTVTLLNDKNALAQYNEFIKFYNFFRIRHVNIAHQYITEIDPSAKTGTQGSGFESFLQLMTDDTSNKTKKLWIFRKRKINKIEYSAIIAMVAFAICAYALSFLLSNRS